jgi:hypothetical protein
VPHQPFLRTLRAQYLGDRLRRMRQERGLRLADVAAHLGRDLSALGRYERAQWPIGRTDVVSLLDLYGQHHPADRAHLLAVAEQVWHLHQWDHYDDGHAGFITPQWLAARAARICVYQPALDTSTLAELLDPAGPTNVEIVAGTAATDELERLAARRGQRVTQIRALPAGPAGGGWEAFTVFAMPDPYPPVGYLNGLAGRLVLEGPTAARLAVRYQQLHHTARPPSTAPVPTAKEGVPSCTRTSSS